MSEAATPATATADEATDLHGAARAIQGILKAERGVGDGGARRRRAGEAGGTRGGQGESQAPGSEASQVRRQERSSTAPDIEAGGGESGGSAADDSAADESAADESERDDENEGEEPSSEDEGPRYRVKVNGREEDVSLPELLKGYQRNADYTRKTMRAGEERRALEAEREAVKTALAAADSERRLHAEALDAAVPQLRQQIEAAFGGVDWNRLAAEAPGRFAELRPIHDALTAQLRQAEASRMQLHQMQMQRSASEQDNFKRYRQEQYGQILERFPELRDPVRGRREMAQLGQYMQEQGYTQKEIASLVDHRDVAILRKAMERDRLTASRAPTAQDAAAPRLQRPGIAPGKGERGQARRQALYERAQRTGRVEDAAKLIEQML